MTKRIFKFRLPVEDIAVVEMPSGAEVLCVQTQEGAPRLWALIDPSKETEWRRFMVVGTGHPVGDVGRYIGTFQLHGGALVFHVFEAVSL